MLIDHGWYLIRDRRSFVRYHFFRRRTGREATESGHQGMGVRLRISSSTIGMESARRYTSVRRKTSAFTSQTYTGGLEKREGSLNFRGMLLGDGAEEKKTGKGMSEEEQMSLRNRFRSTGITKISNRNELEALDRIRQQCIQFLMGLFSGSQNRRPAGMPDSGDLSMPTVSTTKLSYSFKETYMEEEATSFQTTGKVVTADGREITFNLDMEMSRSFQYTYEQSYEMMYRNVSMCDPLVINLDSNIASVSDQKFLFDIDGDGILDRVSQLNAGSGYLALDKNGDGKINDGNELFGPQSGNGFEDLAQYDSDGNGWIDENDEIWSKLLIWTKDENGKDQLYHISDKGIGAICLKNQSTNFSLNSLRDNQTNGVIRSTGIFLYENGGVGTVQHVDMAK